MSLPYFPMFPSDFEAKTSHLTLEEDGAYNRLLRICWMTPGCSLPDDPAWIVRRMRVDLATFERVVAPLIAEFFTRSKGRIFQRKLSEIYGASNEKHQKRVDAGKLGGRPPKYVKTKETSQSNTKAMPKQPEPEPDKKERTPNGVQKKPDMILATLCHEATEPAVVSFIAYRRKSKAGALTETAAKRLAKHLREIFESGGDTDDALAMAEERGWRTVEPEWYFRERAGNGNGSHNANGRGGSSAHDKLMAGFAAVADQEQRKSRLDLFSSPGPEFTGQPDDDLGPRGRVA